MLKSARHTRIRHLVEKQGHVSVTELNDLFDVSDATIRRDLDELAKEGWVRRTHGGATKVERAGKEPPIVQRQGEQALHKERLGKAAAALVKRGNTIFLGSGSTVHQIARNLHNIPELTVITNSLNIANELAERENIELIIIGGLFRRSEQSLVGHIAEQAIREFRADHVFMGMRGIDPQHGFTSDYLPEVATDRAIMTIAPHVVIVADHTKLGVVSTVFLASINAAHLIITDQAAPPDIVMELQELGVEVLVV